MSEPRKRGYPSTINDEQVIQLYNSGNTQQQVADAIGCSQAAVSSILKRNAITTSTRTINYLEVKKLAEIMTNQSLVAEAVGCTQSHISRVLNPIKNGRVIRERKPGRPVVIKSEDVLKLHHEGLLTVEISRELGCSQGWVSTLLNRAGIKTGKRGRNPQAISNAERVIDFITTNGGSLREVLEHLKLNVCAETVRRLAKKRGIPIHNYRYFRMTSGVWVVHKAEFKGHFPKPGDYLLPIKCTHCGFETELLKRELEKQNPVSCPECGRS